MERMKHTGDYELDTINMLEQECSDLEEENKKLDESYQAARDRVIELLGEKTEYLDHIKELQEENDRLKNNAMEDMRVQTKLEEENKNLKEKQKVLDKENCKLIDENVKLKKRIYQNVHGGPRIDYQEFCKKNGI